LCLADAAQQVDGIECGEGLAELFLMFCRDSLRCQETLARRLLVCRISG
jgi:hypothetical protein